MLTSSSEKIHYDANSMPTVGRCYCATWKVSSKDSPLFAFSFLPFVSTAEVRFLLVFLECLDCFKGKWHIWLLGFDFLFWSFFSIKHARIHWKTPLFPFFYTMTNRTERKHMHLIVALEHGFITTKVSFCLVVGVSICNTVIYSNSNHFLLFSSTDMLVIMALSDPQEKTNGLLFSSGTACHLVKNHHGCCLGLLLWQENFHCSPWY